MVVGYKKIGKNASGVPKLNPAQERARRSVSEFRKLLPTLTAYARNLTGRKDVKVEMDAHSNGHTDGKIIYFRPPVALGDVELMRHDKPVCEKRDPETFRQLCPACGVREDILATVYHEISHIAFDTFLKVGSDDVKTALEMIEKTAPEWYYKQVLDRYLATGGMAGIDSFLKLAAVVNPYFKALVNGLEDVRIDERMAVARPGTRIMQAAKIFRVAIEGVEQKDASGRTIYVAWPDYEVNLQAAIALFCYASGYPVKGWFAPQVEEALFDEQITALCRDVRGLQSARKVFDRSFEIFLRMRELGFFVTRDEELPEPPPAPPAPAESEPPQPESDSDTGESDSDSCEPDGSDSGSDGSSDSEGSDSERDEGASSDSGGVSEGESDPSPGSTPEAESDDAAGDPDPDIEGDGNGQDSDAGSEPDNSSDSSTDDGSESSDNGDGAESGGDRGEPSSDSEGSSDGEEQTASDPEAGREDGGLEEEGTEASKSIQSDNPPDADGDGGGDDPGSGTSDESTAEADSASTGSSGGSGPGDGGADGSESEQLAGEAGDSDGSSGDLERGESDSSDSDRSDTGGDEEAEGERGEVEGESPEGDGADNASDGTEDSSGSDAAGSELDTEATFGKSDSTESERSESDADLSRSSGDGGSDSESSEDPGPDDGTDPTDDSFVEPIDYRPEEKIDGTEGEETSIVPPTIDSDHPIELVDMGLHSELEEPAPSVEQEIENAIVQGVYFTQPSSHIGGLAVWKYSEAADDAERRPWHAWGGTYYDGFYGTQSHADIDPVGERYLGPALMKLRLAFEDNKRSHRNRNQRAGKIDGRTLGKRAWQTDDDRLFGRKVLPKKKDYFVVIGLDISGSTRGVNLKMIKEAALAQAELCQRIGVKFCVYAHTGGPLDLDRLDARYVDIYEIKGPEQPWDNKTREALMEIGPSAANLDGHTLEFYRKVAERDQATNKVILYYSDGAMPAENYNEELEILQSEIQTCRKLKITLLGVGVRTDAPKDHGLDTVQIDDSSEVGKVVAHLERALIP